MKAVWFRRPGTASIFTPSAGTVHAWRTSSAVTKTRIGDCIGTTIRWSASKRRNCPGERSSVWIMYESNSRFW